MPFHLPGALTAAKLNCEILFAIALLAVRRIFREEWLKTPSLKKCKSASTARTSNPH